MTRAQPHHIQRARIVGVVGLGFLAAHPARLRRYSPIAHGITERGRGRLTLRVFCPPSRLDALCQQPAMRLARSLTVICAVSLKVGRARRCHVCSLAGFALTEQAIRHLRVCVEVSSRLLNAALEAGFNECLHDVASARMRCPRRTCIRSKRTGCHPRRCPRPACSGSPARRDRSAYRRARSRPQQQPLAA